MSFYEPKTQKTLFGNAALWVIGAVLLVGLISAGLWSFGVFTADIKGRGDARKQILSADNRIQAYDHFFNLCASVQTADQSLAASYHELAGSSGDDRERVRTNITGQLINRAEAANQYNADARKSYTIGQFRSLDLPYQLPATYSKGEVTSCEN